MNLYLSEREAGCLKNSFPLTQGKLFAIGDGKKKKNYGESSYNKTDKKQNERLYTCALCVNTLISFLKSTDPALLMCISLCETAFRP